MQNTTWLESLESAREAQDLVLEARVPSLGPTAAGPVLGSLPSICACSAMGNLKSFLLTFVSLGALGQHGLSLAQLSISQSCVPQLSLCLDQGLAASPWL